MDAEGLPLPRGEGVGKGLCEAPAPESLGEALTLRAPEALADAAPGLSLAFAEAEALPLPERAGEGERGGDRVRSAAVGEPRGERDSPPVPVGPFCVALALPEALPAAALGEPLGEPHALPRAVREAHALPRAVREARALSEGEGVCEGGGVTVGEGARVREPPPSGDALPEPLFVCGALPLFEREAQPDAVAPPECAALPLVDPLRTCVPLGGGEALIKELSRGEVLGERLPAPLALPSGERLSERDADAEGEGGGEAVCDNVAAFVAASVAVPLPQGEVRPEDEGAPLPEPPPLSLCGAVRDAGAVPHAVAPALCEGECDVLSEAIGLREGGGERVALPLAPGLRDAEGGALLLRLRGALALGGALREGVGRGEPEPASGDALGGAEGDGEGEAAGVREGEAQPEAPPLADAAPLGEPPPLPVADLSALREGEAPGEALPPTLAVAQGVPRALALLVGVPSPPVAEGRALPTADGDGVPVPAALPVWRRGGLGERGALAVTLAEVDAKPLPLEAALSEAAAEEAVPSTLPEGATERGGDALAVGAREKGGDTVGVLADVAVRREDELAAAAVGEGEALVRGVE